MFNRTEPWGSCVLQLHCTHLKPAFRWLFNTQINDPFKKNIKNKIPPPRAAVSLNSTFYNLLAKCIIHIHTVQSETTQNHLLKHWYESPPLQKLLKLALFFSLYFLNRKQNNLWKKNIFFLNSILKPIKILWYIQDLWHHVQMITKIFFSRIVFFFFCNKHLFLCLVQAVYLVIYRDIDFFYYLIKACEVNSK